MDNLTLRKLIRELKRIELLLEAYRLCLSYSSNLDLPLNLKADGKKQLPWYCEELTLAIERVEDILLEEMKTREVVLCLE